MKNIIIFIFIVLFIISCTVDGAWDSFRNQIEETSIPEGGEEITIPEGGEEITIPEGGEEITIPEEYNTRVKITIDNSSQNETFIDFPVLVILNTSRITYSSISADGTGIKFISSDHTEELAYEVEEWNSGGESVLWVKVPSISDLSNSDYFWLYYSTESNSDNTHPADVWSNNYLLVWHMNDTGGLIKDSTSFGLNGVPDLGLYATDQYPGIIAGAQGYNSDPDNITINSATLDNLGPVTFSFWMKDLGHLGIDTILEKGGLNIRLPEASPNNTIEFIVGYDGGTNLGLFHENSWASTEWSSFYFTWTGSSDFNEVNISNKSVPLLSPFLYTSGTGNRTPDTGSDLVIGNNSANDQRFNGYLDEIRISNVVRTSAWISAQYLSMTDSFLSYGSEESVSD